MGVQELVALCDEAAEDLRQQFNRTQRGWLLMVAAQAAEPAELEALAEAVLCHGGEPVPALDDVRKEARMWAATESLPTRRAYLAACWNTLPRGDRQASCGRRRNELGRGTGGHGAASRGRGTCWCREACGLCVSELATRPAPQRKWHVEGLVPGRNVALLYGDGGTGKSLLALQLAASTVLGRQWIGQDVRAGPVLYLSAEDDEEELHMRLLDIEFAEGIRLADLDNFVIRSLAGGDALLATLDRTSNSLVETELFKALDATMADLRPELLVLDTLSDLHSGDENNRVHARQFVGMTRGLAIRHDCAVVLLAHPSLTGLNSGTGTSGSTGWSNSVRSRLNFERIIQDGYEHEPDARRLTTKKINYGRTGGEIRLTWRAGVFVTDRAETSLDRMAGTAKAERVFLKLLSEFTAQGRRVNTSGRQQYAPKIFEEHPDSEGCTKRAFKAAMERLLSSGRIVIKTEGPPSRQRSFLEITRQE